MMCVICRQAETIDGHTLMTFERGEFRLLINAVPARVCLRCGETYVEEETAQQLLRIAKLKSEEGNLNTECDYSTL